MKIWFLTDEFPPNYGGGIGMYVDIVSRGFAEAGHDIRVITADKKNKIEKVSENLTYVRFQRPTGMEGDRLGYEITLCKAYYHHVMKLIDTIGAPDLIEMPEYNAIGYYVLQAKHLGEQRLRGVKLVVHCHTPSFELMRINRSPEYAFPVYWIGQMERFCIKAADAVLTQSHFLHDQLAQYAEKGEIEIIPLPYRFDKENLPYQYGDHLLYAGRLEYRKGIWQLLKEMAILWEEGSKTPLVLVGGDVHFEPSGKTIGQMIRENYGKWMTCGLLQLQDKVPPQKLEQMMSEARAVVVPSVYENYPYINVMAMANHVPVIVSRQGGQAEAVAEDGVNGFIFDWNKKDDCLRVLRRVLAMDKATMREVGERGYQQIKKCCDIERNIQCRYSFFERVVQQPDYIKPYPFLNRIPQTPLPDAIAQSMDTEGMLSVVIPYYNLGATVEETIRSVLHSDYGMENMEIILLDDGSTDQKSMAKADEMARKYPVRLERIRNGGLANARNTGIQMAHGEYVCFLDADDTVQPTYFSKCIDVMKLHDNISFVYSWVQYFEGSHEVWTTFDTAFPYFCAQNQLTCMAVARRKDYLAYGYNHPEMEYGLEDYDGWLGLAEHGRMGACIPEPLVNYRIRPASMARSMSASAIIYLRSNLKQLHPGLYRQYGDELYLLMMQNGTNLRWNNPLATNCSSDQYGTSEVDVLRQELAAIKQRRGYRMMDRVATWIYRNRVIHAIRFRILPAVKREYVRLRHHRG